MNPERRRRRVLLLLTGGLVVLAALAWYLVPPGDPAGPWWAFLVAGIAGEFLVLGSLANRLFPTSVAAVVAFALLGNPPWLVAAVAAGAWLVAALVKRAMGEPIAIAGLARRIGVSVALAGFVALGGAIAPSVAVGGGSVQIPLTAIASMTLLLVLGSPIRAAVNASSRALRSSVFVDDLRDTWAPTVTLASSGALTAVAYDVLGVGALALMALPVLAVRGGLHRYIGIRRTYDQTIVAMSHMTELTGHIRPGHGIRVRNLSVDVGRELALTEGQLRVVERASYLHEIGRIATDDPDYAAPDEDVAQASAQIVGGAGSMPEVTDVIARHREPYRRPGTGDDVTLPLASRIVRTVCEFDRLAGNAVGEEVWTALDHLHRSMAYEHDPSVVGALVRVVEARRLVA